MLLLLEYIRETDKWMMLELNFNADMVIVKNFNGSIEIEHKESGIDRKSV